MSEDTENSVALNAHRTLLCLYRELELGSTGWSQQCDFRQVSSPLWTSGHWGSEYYSCPPCPMGWSESWETLWLIKHFVTISSRIVTTSSQPSSPTADHKSSAGEEAKGWQDLVRIGEEMMDPGERQVTEFQIKDEERWKMPNGQRKEDAGREGDFASLVIQHGFGSAQETQMASPWTDSCRREARHPFQHPSSVFPMELGSTIPGSCPILWLHMSSISGQMSHLPPGLQ